MRLYLLRHGIAEDGRPGQPDSDRKLTDEGIAEIQAESETLKRLELELDLILTSPYPRAARTAEIVAQTLGQTDRLHSDARLASGSRFGDIQQVVEEHSNVKRLMLVGHNPDLPMVAEQLIGGGSLELKKGGLIRIDLDRFEPGQGVLRWLVTPSFLVFPVAVVPDAPIERPVRR